MLQRSTVMANFHAGADFTVQAEVAEHDNIEPYYRLRFGEMNMFLAPEHMVTLVAALAAAPVIKSKAMLAAEQRAADDAAERLILEREQQETGADYCPTRE